MALRRTVHAVLLPICWHQPICCRMLCAHIIADGVLHLVAGCHLAVRSFAILGFGLFRNRQPLLGGFYSRCAWEHGLPPRKERKKSRGIIPPCRSHFTSVIDKSPG